MPWRLRCKQIPRHMFASRLVAALEHRYVLGALDDEGLLTRLVRRMVEFPMTPALAKMLLTAVNQGCSEGVLTIVAMLSVENVFDGPRDKAAAADQRKSRFHALFGDHLMYLKVHNSRAGGSTGGTTEPLTESEVAIAAREERSALRANLLASTASTLNDTDLDDAGKSAILESVSALTQVGAEVSEVEAPDAAAAAAAGSFPSGGFFALDTTGYAVQVSQIEQRLIAAGPNGDCGK